MTPRGTSEGELVCMAVLAWIGARLALPLPLWPAVLTVLVAIGLRRPAILLLGVAVLASALAANAHASHRPVSPSQRQLVGRLVVDPRPAGPVTWRAEVRAENGDRLLVRAAGPPAWVLQEAKAGDLVSIEGTQTPLEADGWFLSRHLVGSITPSAVTVIGDPPRWQLPAEWLRSAVTGGGELVGTDGQALYDGLVIGDDRFQLDSQRARFRAVGLAHLLAVSGQNVAFALAVSGPLLRRLGLHAGFVTTLLVLFWFAVATRAEPSVIRATLTAAIAAWSVLRGTRANGVRSLALTVVGALLIDPFLVFSVGFSLSTLASAGIILGSEPISQKLSGPPWLVTPLAVTLSAQVAVAPLLVGTFGPMSIASIPANVAAGWAAGLVMAWGLSIGVVASVLPVKFGELVQLPAGWLVRWIDWVATISWRLPLPVLDGWTMATIFALGIGVWLLTGRVRPARWLLILCILVVAFRSIPVAPQAPRQIEGGGFYWPSTPTSGSVLVVAARNDGRLVEALVELRISTIDTLILTRGNRTTASLVVQIVDLTEVSEILAPAQHVVVGAKRLVADTKIPTGQGSLHLTPGDDSIEIDLIDADR